MPANNIKPEDLHAANTAAFLVSSLKRQADKASSGKRQAPSCKRQAPSRKRQAPSPVNPHKVSSD
jgi:hypothetical protein